MIAALPMYDWPEIREETDAFWAHMAAALREAGFDAPEALTRPGDPWPVWRDPDLVLAQTCGLPFAARLTGEVSLLGAPDYGLPGCPAGAYNSPIIVRADDPAKGLGALRGARFAYNMRESQSGWAALDRIWPIEERFGELVETGAHRSSITAVAEGRADAAAIDGVAWALAQRHEPAAEGVRILTATPPTPGLPYITALRPGEEQARMAQTVADAIHSAPAEARAALHVDGFVTWREADYAPLAAGWPA